MDMGKWGHVAPALLSPELQQDRGRKCSELAPALDDST